MVPVAKRPRRTAATATAPWRSDQAATTTRIRRIEQGEGRGIDCPPAIHRADEGAAGCADFAGRTGCDDFDPTRPLPVETTCRHLRCNRHNSTSGNGWQVGCSPSTDLTTGQSKHGQGARRQSNTAEQRRAGSNTGRASNGRARRQGNTAGKGQRGQEQHGGNRGKENGQGVCLARANPKRIMGILLASQALRRLQ